MGRHRALVAAGIFGGAVLARLPFATTHLWAWDSVLYARALERGFHVAVDPSMSRPHPPGYVWYVGLASLARDVLGDSNAALVLVSILAAAAGAALIWIVASRYMRPAVAFVVALAFVASPLVWTYSEIAYPYTVLALLSLALGSFFIERRHPLLASLAFGVLSGARQDILLLLAPIWIWSIWPLRPRQTAAAAGLVGLGTLTWWVPSAILSGGPLAYMDAVLHQTAKVTTTYSVPVNGLHALVYNTGLTFEALAWALGPMAIPLLVGVARVIGRGVRARSLHVSALTMGLLVWAAPALAFYTLVHIGEWGYVLSVVPVLLLGAGIFLDRAVAQLPPRALRFVPIATGLALALPALLFLVGDGAYQAVVGDAEFSAAGLARHDVALAARVAYVRREFASRSTLIVARDDYLLVRYYLPDYRTMYWDPDPYGHMSSTRHRAMRPTNIVVFTAGLQPERAGDIRRIEVADGVDLAYLSLDRGSVFELDGEKYVVRDAPGR